MTRRRLRAAPSTLLALGLALIWTAFIVRWHVQGLSSPIDRFEEVCLDLRFKLAPAPPPPRNVVIVAIDNETVRRAGAYPLPRAQLAAMIQAVARQKPRAIALDMLLLDPGPAEADALLGQSLQSVPAVVAAAAVFGDKGSGETSGSLPRPSGLLWPIKPVAEAAEIGPVNLSTGFGGVPRHVPLLFDDGNKVVAAFVLIAVALADGVQPKFAERSVSLGKRAIALDLGANMVLRYYGARGTIPTLSGSALDGLDGAALKDRIVVIGTTATGVGDSFPTPFSTVVPGVEILATAIANLADGDALVRTQATRWLDAVAAASLAAATVFLIALRRGVVGLVLVVLLAAAWAAVSFLAFCQGYWISTMLPIAAMTPVAASFGAARLWQERRTAVRLAGVEGRLSAFQARPLSTLLSTDPAFLAKPQIQDAAVLFVDLVGYTAISESRDPVTVRNLLKSFHALVDRVIEQHGGFVVSFMGDGAMVLFGFPKPDADTASRSVAALADLELRLAAWGRSAETGVSQRVDARLAAHYGSVVISRLGGDSHQQITATGDSVNVASRLLDIAKQERVSLVISDALFRAAGPAGRDKGFSAPAEVTIRGRSQPLLVRLGSRIIEPDGSDRQRGGPEAPIAL